MIFLVWLTLLAQTTPSSLIMWHEVAGAVAYRVERTVPGVAFGGIGETTDLWLRDTLPSATTLYIYRVAARDVEGKLGEWSSQVSYKFSDVQPATPTGLSVSNASSSNPGRVSRRLSWNPVTRAESGAVLPSSPAVRYKVYRYAADPSTNAYGQLVTTTTFTNFTDDGLQKNKTFYWAVTAEFDYTDRYIESYGSSAVRSRT